MLQIVQILVEYYVLVDVFMFVPYIQSRCDLNVVTSLELSTS